jgi:antitoxin FitA
MPSIQVRDLPEQIYRKLQINAKKDHRSLSQQAIVTLKKGLGIDENPKERRRMLVDQILSRRVLIDSDKLEDPTNLIREDRDR